MYVKIDFYRLTLIRYGKKHYLLFDRDLTKIVF